MRIPMVIAFVAASARLLLDAPPGVPYGIACGLLLLLGGRALYERARDRRRRAAAPTAAPEPDWEDCPERRTFAGMVWKCGCRKGHGGVHESSGPWVEW